MFHHFLLIQHCTSPEARPLEIANFARAAGLAPEYLKAVDALAAPLSESVLNDINGIFLGGSGWSVFDDVPNLAATKQLLTIARKRGIPMFGVCFGAQLLAATFGGEVERDSANEEFGTVEIIAHPEAAADFLFGKMPQQFMAQSSHQDRITQLPVGAKVLAMSERCSAQAFVFPGANIYGVQFHPERRKEDVETLCAVAGYEGFGAKILAGPFSLNESPQAAALLKNFVDLVEKKW